MSRQNLHHMCLEIRFMYYKALVISFAMVVICKTFFSTSMSFRVV
jgi:hypothetical protein